MKIPQHYAGSCIAVIDDEIIASGKTQLEAYQEAKKSYPHKLVKLIYIPTKAEMATFL